MGVSNSRRDARHPQQFHEALSAPGEAAGVHPGGFHDSRHTVNTLVQSLGSRSRVAADILGHTTAKLAENLYDHASVAEMGKALSSVVNELLPNGNNSTSVR